MQRRARKRPAREAAGRQNDDDEKSSAPIKMSLLRFDDSAWHARGGFLAPCFDDARMQEQRFDDACAPVIELAEGATQCRACKSFKLKTAEVQSRSLDEKSTVFYECVECKASWTE